MQIPCPKGRGRELNLTGLRAQGWWWLFACVHQGFVLKFCVLPAYSGRGVTGSFVDGSVHRVSVEKVQVEKSREPFPRVDIVGRKE